MRCNCSNQLVVEPTRGLCLIFAKHLYRIVRIGSMYDCPCGKVIGLKVDRTGLIIQV